MSESEATHWPDTLSMTPPNKSPPAGHDGNPPSSATVSEADLVDRVARLISPCPLMIKLQIIFVCFTCTSNLPHEIPFGLM